MKSLVKLAVAAAALFAISGSLAFSDTAASTSYFKPGTIALSIGVNPFWGLGLVPGVEFSFTEFNIANVVPIQLGISVKGQIALPIWLISSSYFGVGVFVTAHYDLKYLKINNDFLNKLSVYLGVGGRFSSHDMLPWFANYDGVSYFFTDNFSAFLEYNYWGDSGTTIGVLFKF